MPLSEPAVPVLEPFLAEVERRYALSIAAVEPLAGGYECDVVLLGTSDGGRYVLRVSPSGRSIAELAWAYDLAAYAATRIPEAVPPLAHIPAAALLFAAGLARDSLTPPRRGG
jgi:Ser/Thr protein kinase RdoA (MazF antagonist)